MSCIRSPFRPLDVSCSDKCVCSAGTTVPVCGCSALNSLTNPSGGATVAFRGVQESNSNVGWSNVTEKHVTFIVNPNDSNSWIDAGDHDIWMEFTENASTGTTTVRMYQVADYIYVDTAVVSANIFQCEALPSFIQFDHGSTLLFDGHSCPWWRTCGACQCMGAGTSTLDPDSNCTCHQTHTGTECNLVLPC